MTWLEAVAIGCVMVLTFALCYVLVVKFTSPIEFNLQYEPEPMGDVVEFIMLAKRFASEHKYDLLDYNCVNYSTDLYEIATQLGFQLSMVKGCTEEGNITCHQWLRLAVDFEPQHGEFVDYSNDYPDQEVIR